MDIYTYNFDYISIYVVSYKTRSLELNRHEGRKLIMKELDKMINGDASKKSMEELKAKERARIKRKRAKAKYDKAEKEKKKNL